MDSSSYLTGAGAEATHIAADMTRGNEREGTPGETRAARWSTFLQLHGRRAEDAIRGRIQINRWGKIKQAEISTSRASSY